MTLKYFIINKYLTSEFTKVVLNMCLVFICMGFVLNLFEEINFFKDFDIGISLPILLSSLYVPTLLYNMFPFVILLSGIWFFLKIKKNDEIVAMKISGISNFGIIILPSFVALIMGIVFITMVNPVTAVLMTKYENIKGSFEKDQEYLAAITINGIWIKEKNASKNNFIRSAKLKDNYLLNLSLYEFDQDNNFIRRIEAKSVNISTQDWLIHDATISDRDGNILSEDIKNLSYRSLYDLKKIKSLYSNLDTVSFWNLDSEIEKLENRGYSSSEMRAKFQRSLAFPFFLLSMVLLSGVFTLGISYKENNWKYVFIAIISSVLIFYFNRFSEALGKTEKLPIELSVWMPILIIFIFSAVGLINANQK